MHLGDKRELYLVENSTAAVQLRIKTKIHDTTNFSLCLLHGHTIETLDHLGISHCPASCAIGPLYNNFL